MNFLNGPSGKVSSMRVSTILVLVNVLGLVWHSQITGHVMPTLDVTTLGEFYRKVWSLGEAGVEVPLTHYGDGVTFDVAVNSSERAKFLKVPRMH